jgi:hypothetical protein
MQKVEGSNPFSRFRKACICGSSLCAQSAGRSASVRIQSGFDGYDAARLDGNVAQLQVVYGCVGPRRSVDTQKVVGSNPITTTPERLLVVQFSLELEGLRFGSMFVAEFLEVCLGPGAGMLGVAAWDAVVSQHWQLVAPKGRSG